MNEKIKYGLSAAVLALIGAGASAPEILDQFLDEKEGNHTTAYRDGAGIWTICVVPFWWMVSLLFLA